MSASNKVRSVNVRISGIEDYVRIYNGIFRLTDMEITVLSKLIKKHKRFTKKSLDKSAFDSDVKQEIADSLELSSLNNYISKLAAKKAIIKNGNGYDIHPMLIPGPHRAILFNLKIDEQSPDNRHSATVSVSS